MSEPTVILTTADLATWPRVQEVIEYCDTRELDTAGAIQALVNSGLSHQRRPRSFAEQQRVSADFAEANGYEVVERLEDEGLVRVDDIEPAPDRVYVMSFSHEGIGYTSTHRTYDGAEARLHEKAAEFGFANLLKADELTFGISYLDVEE
ncbi:hypothetical protein ACWF99_23750 [Nocardia sp. NPDC055002]